MRIFVAGATGVLGRRAVTALVGAGHRVSGVARSDEKAAALRSMGAEPVAVDVFDAKAVAGAFAGARPGYDVVCNFATRIPRFAYFLARAWRTNNRLHADLSRVLVDAAIASGATRYIQHSVSFMYADGADTWLDEDARIDPPPHGLPVLEAEAQARRFTDAGGTGIALRFGLFYGPDAPSARDLLRLARFGFVPLPGPRDAYIPLVHTEDLGTSVVAALDAPAGAYNVVDGDALTRAQLGEVMAAVLGRKRLRIAPRFTTRLMGKRVNYLSRSQRVSNARFKQAASWSPSVPVGRDGWATMAKPSG